MNPIAFKGKRFGTFSGYLVEKCNAGLRSIKNAIDVMDNGGLCGGNNICFSINKWSIRQYSTTFYDVWITFFHGCVIGHIIQI